MRMVLEPVEGLVEVTASPRAPMAISDRSRASRAASSRAVAAAKPRTCARV